MVSVLAAFFPILNYEKVVGNLDAAEAMIGSLVGGKGAEIGLLKDPNAPSGDLDPPIDPAPQEGSDVGTFLSKAQAAEAEGQQAPTVLEPGETWVIAFAYV